MVVKEVRKLNIAYFGISICVNSSNDGQSFSIRKVSVVASVEVLDVIDVKHSIIESVNSSKSSIGAVVIRVGEVLFED